VPLFAPFTWYPRDTLEFRQVETKLYANPHSKNAYISLKRGGF